MSLFQRFLMSVLCAFIGGTLQAKPTEIVLWHSLAGQLGSAVQSLANGFNQSQTAYRVKPVYKGDYVESLTSFAAAFRAKRAPALVQVFEVGTATMLFPSGIIKPVDRLMREQGFELPKDSFFPAVRSYYSEHGQLMAMPFNISFPVIFYNKAALAKVGYSAETFPATWDALETLAVKLKKAGFACAYTSAYPAWMFIESFSALHGLLLSDKEGQRATYNNDKVIRYLTRLRRWQGLHYFDYGGRSDDATILFSSGRCPLLSQSSGAYQSLSAMVPFPMGMAALPVEHKDGMHQYNNVVGGAALWVTAGQSPRIDQGIAQFFMYLTKPEVQEKWYQSTGYLPLGVTGIYQALLDKKPNALLLLAQSEWMNNHQTVFLPRLKAQNQIRSINDEALEMIFAGIKTPREAMDDAVNRANHVLSRFIQHR